MKDKRFKIRISRKEYELLQKKSEKTGLSKSEIIRQYINSTSPSNEEDINILKQLILSINKTGENINRIAKKVNEFGLNRNDLMSLRVYNQEVINNIKEAVKSLKG